MNTRLVLFFSIYLMSHFICNGQSNISNTESSKASISLDSTNNVAIPIVINANFPAYSSNGKYIALIYSEYSCCLATPEEFHLIKIDSKKIEKKIVLWPGEEATPFSLEEKKQHVEEAAKILSDGKFVAMKKITSYTIIKNKFPIFSQSEIQSLIIKDKNKILKSDLFQVLKVKVNPYCCGYGIDDKEQNCSLELGIKNIWINKKNTFILIEHGTNTHIDGCDRGPFFQVISLHSSEK